MKGTQGLDHINKARKPNERIHFKIRVVSTSRKPGSICLRVPPTSQGRHARHTPIDKTRKDGDRNRLVCQALVDKV